MCTVPWLNNPVTQLLHKSLSLSKPFIYNPPPEVCRPRKLDTVKPKLAEVKFEHMQLLGILLPQTVNMLAPCI